MQKNKYRRDIDGLRSIAVIVVLLFHLGFQKFSGGYVGVDVFFVISGFLITGLIRDEILRTGTFSFSKFYGRRARRLFPALFFTLFLSLIAAFLLFSTQHFQRFGGSLIHAVTGLSNIYFWQESGYFNTLGAYKPLLHFWSLSVEEQFYLFWPVSLFLLYKLPGKKLKYIVILLVALTSLGLNFIFQDGHSSVLSHYFPTVAKWFSDGQATIYYLMPFRVFELMIGAGMVWLIKYQPKKILSEILLSLGLIMIGYSVIAFSDQTIFPSYNALVPCLGAALALYSGRAKYVGFILNNKLSVGIGLISYSLYLIHWPIIVFYRYAISDKLNNHDKIGIFLAAILIAYLMYLFIETPFRSGKKAKALSYPAFGLSCAMLSILLILVSSNIWANSGWTWRVETPEKFKALLKDSKQFHKDNFGGKGFPYTGMFGDDKGVADLIVIGDSHAQHYSYGLNKYIREMGGKKIYISSASCLVLPGLSRIHPSINFDKICPEKLTGALSVAEKNPNSALFISESWIFQLSQGKILKTGVSTKKFAGDKSGDFLAKKLQELKTMIGGRPLIVVGHVPGSLKQDTVTYFSRPKWLSEPSLDDLKFPANKGAGYKLNQSLAEFAAKTEGIYFLNPYDVFCPNGICTSITQNKIYFSDKYHLSFDGSDEFVRHFKDEIMGILENSSTVQ